MPSLLFLQCTLEWSASDYSYIVAIQTAASSIGYALFPLIFKRVILLRDSGIVFFGVAFSASKVLLLGLSKHTWMVYLCKF